MADSNNHLKTTKVSSKFDQNFHEWKSRPKKHRMFQSLKKKLNLQDAYALSVDRIAWRRIIVSNWTFYKITKCLSILIYQQNLILSQFESFKSSQFSPTLFGERVLVELTIQIKKNALQFVPVRSSRIRAPIQGPQCLATWSPEWEKIVNFRRPSKQCEKQVLVNSVYWASGGWLIPRRVHRRCSITCQC